MTTRETALSAKSPLSTTPKAAQTPAPQLGGVHMPPKAVQHTGVEVGHGFRPPKARQHVGAELGGRSLPTRLVRLG